MSGRGRGSSAPGGADSGGFAVLRLRRLRGDGATEGAGRAEGDDAGETLPEVRQVTREIRELRAARG